MWSSATAGSPEERCLFCLKVYHTSGPLQIPSNRCVVGWTASSNGITQGVCALPQVITNFDMREIAPGSPWAALLYREPNNAIFIHIFGWATRSLVLGPALSLRKLDKFACLRLSCLEQLCELLASAPCFPIFQGAPCLRSKTNSSLTAFASCRQSDYDQSRTKVKSLRTKEDKKSGSSLHIAQTGSKKTRSQGQVYTLHKQGQQDKTRSQGRLCNVQM